MRYTIDQIKQKTVPIARDHGVRRMCLFGSYARGDASDVSDIDIYIDKGRIAGLIQYFSFVNDLEDALKCHVDVVTTGISDRDFLDAIMKDGIVLYEESARSRL